MFNILDYVNNLRKKKEDEKVRQEMLRIAIEENKRLREENAKLYRSLPTANTVVRSASNTYSRSSRSNRDRDGLAASEYEFPDVMVVPTYVPSSSYSSSSSSSCSDSSSSSSSSCDSSSSSSSSGGSSGGSD